MSALSSLSRIESGERGVLSRGPWSGVVVIAWMALLFAAAIGALFVTLRLPDWFGVLQDHDLACAVVTPVIALLMYAGAVRLVERRQASELAPSRAPLALLTGAAVGCAFISLVLALLWAFGLYRIAPGHWKHALHYFVFNAWISALLEELAFRAILLRLVTRLFGPVTGLVISAVLFGLAHAGHASAMSVVELILNGGLLLGLLYVVSGRLWLSIGAHLAYDFTESSLMGSRNTDGLLLIAPAPGYPDWLTGGTFGPDGSVLAIVVGIVVMAAIVVVRRRLDARAADAAQT